jgi:hypothetical protein
MASWHINVSPLRTARTSAVVVEILQLIDILSEILGRYIACCSKLVTVVSIKCLQSLPVVVCACDIPREAVYIRVEILRNAYCTEQVAWIGWTLVIS